MTIDDQIEDEKMQCDINRKAAKMSVLSSYKLISLSILLVKKYYYLLKTNNRTSQIYLLSSWQSF